MKTMKTMLVDIAMALISLITLMAVAAISGATVGQIGGLIDPWGDHWIVEMSSVMGLFFILMTFVIRAVDRIERHFTRRA